MITCVAVLNLFEDYVHNPATSIILLYSDSNSRQLILKFSPTRDSGCKLVNTEYRKQIPVEECSNLVKFHGIFSRIKNMELIGSRPETHLNETSSSFRSPDSAHRNSQSKNTAHLSFILIRPSQPISSAHLQILTSSILKFSSAQLELKNFQKLK